MLPTPTLQMYWQFGREKCKGSEKDGIHERLFLTLHFLQHFFEAFVADASHVVSVTVWGVMADRFYTQGTKALDCDGFPTVKLIGFDLGVDKKVFPAVAKVGESFKFILYFRKDQGE